MIPKSMLVNIARENGLYVDAIKKCDNIAELELSEEPLKFRPNSILAVVEYYELLEHCLGSLEQVKSKGWSRTEPAPIF